MTKDDNILETMQKDTSQGFTQLVKCYQEPVYWHIRRLVVSHADAEDATQETFIRVFRTLCQLPRVKSLKAWVFKIATHEALRLISRRKTQLVSLEDMGEATFQAYADEYVDYGRTAEVKMQKAILSLPVKQQLAFNLRYYDELSYSEIAEVTGSSTVGAKMNFHLAKDKIIKYLRTND
jgi:RNA polymerase sigma-70 factor (ECF subfamily)